MELARSSYYDEPQGQPIEEARLVERIEEISLPSMQDHLPPKCSEDCVVTNLFIGLGSSKPCVRSAALLSGS